VRRVTANISVSRSDRDIDRQVQLDKTRLQQRHGQVIVQFNPCVTAKALFDIDSHNRFDGNLYMASGRLQVLASLNVGRASN
jgi:hypothetical protein